MKKVLAIILSALFIFAFAACGGTDTPANDTTAAPVAEDTTAAEITTLTVGFDAEFPPFGYLDEATGEYVGFDLDLAAEVAKRNGWEFKAQPIDWNVKDAELKSGAIDCIWNGFTLNGREDLYTWTEPYINNSQVVIVAADSGIKALTDLAGKVVCVQDDSSAQAAINDEENADMVALRESLKSIDVQKDYMTAYLNLKAGAVDAVAVDIGVAKNLIKDSEGEYVILDEILAPEEYAVGFLLGNTALRDTVQKTYDEMLADGTVMQIAEKYAEDGLQIDNIITK